MRESVPLVPLGERRDKHKRVRILDDVWPVLALNPLPAEVRYAKIEVFVLVHRLVEALCANSYA